MKILFIVATIGKQITSDTRWINNSGSPLITEMTDDHIRNTRCWLLRQVEALDELGYEEPYNGNYTYSEWLKILEGEEGRRKAVIRAKELDKINKLKLATLSLATRKKRAAKLLENPTAANIAEAEELLGFEITKNDVKEYPFPNIGNRTYDYVKQEYCDDWGDRDCED